MVLVQWHIFSTSEKSQKYTTISKLFDIVFLTDVDFGDTGQPKLCKNLDFGIDLSSRGTVHAALLYALRAKLPKSPLVVMRRNGICIESVC